jgi:hypothetical protein
MVVSLADPPQQGPLPDRVLRTTTLAHAALWRDIERLTAGLDLSIAFIADPGLFVARLESAQPDLVIFDADAPWGNIDLLRYTRSLWPAVRIFAITHRWSERADDLRDHVDGLLYKPPRIDQWRSALAKRWPATHSQAI